MPYAGHGNDWRSAKRARLNRLMAAAHEVVEISSSHTKGCFFERNRYLVDHADTLIAVLDGSETGGTHDMLQYAQKQGKTIRVINPLLMTCRTEISPALRALANTEQPLSPLGQWRQSNARAMAALAEFCDYYDTRLLSGSNITSEEIAELSEYARLGQRLDQAREAQNACRGRALKDFNTLSGWLGYLRKLEQRNRGMLREDEEAKTGRQKDEVINGQIEECSQQADELEALLLYLLF